jgi:hypothetical protein
MSWFPIGPNAVFAPRDGSFKRLSRRNEWGRQGLVANIAIDPTDPGTIYVAELPTSGGASAFRTQDNGSSWVSISDSLHQTNPNVTPSCFAVNPANPETIYMGDYSGNVYVSPDQGNTWPVSASVPGGVFKLIVDPRTASDLATTVILGAGSSGVWRSADGGNTWTNVLPGDINSLAAYMPSGGGDQYYAGVSEAGVYQATDPSGAWTNLNNQGIGLPAFAPGSPPNFTNVLVDYCPLNPSRVYAWFANPNQTTGIYTTSSALTSWAQVAAASPPSPSYGFYSYLMAVAPNSPGDGLNDILFFGAIPLFRSIDGAQTWTTDQTGFHADQHAFAFFPANPPAGVIPAIYMGCDGGIAMSDQFCDPTFAFGTAATYFDELDNYTDLGFYQTLNHGKQSSALYQYNSDASISALGYIGCQDTGIGAGAGALGWRGIADADAGSIAIAQGSSGVVVWGNLGEFAPPEFRILVFNDQGQYTPSSNFATLGSGGPLVSGPSNYVAGLDGKCLAGLVVQDSNRTLNLAINATGVQIATPSSMANIVIGTVVAIDSGSNAETVVVTATTATTFTASFTKTHSAGVTIQLVRAFAGRIDQSGIASQISQEMGLNEASVNIIAAHPTDADILYCGTTDQRVFSTSSGSTANASTVWSEATGNKPAGIQMSSIDIDGAGNVYVLLQWAVTSGSGELSTTTPLFEISSGNWVAQSCSNLPTAGFNYGRLRADPVQPNTLYASNGARVYQLTLSAGVWNWQDISDNLPGQWIYDLWIGNIGSGAAPKVLLRAGIPTRGIWEKDVTAGASTPTIALYVRDNTLDQGWLPRCPDGVPDPYDPGNPGSMLYHYMCADIKVDAQEPGTASVAPYFQTDPETPPPITGVIFDELVDNSQNLPGADQALVHVQVHNRSNTAANGVSVWAVYSNAGAGLQGLNVSPSQGNAFNFWSQFTVTGQIIPNLPGDSPWHSVGAPQILSGITAATPKVASWNWTVPTLASGDPGHYCIAVFLHSAISPVNETSMDVDDITPRNRQVGQKNLHIGPPLPPSPGPGDGGPKGGGAPAHLGQLEFVEFNNPTAAAREANLVIDLRGLPPQLSVAFQTTRLETADPLPRSITGVARTRRENPDEFVETEGDERECGCFENLQRLLAGLKRILCKGHEHHRLPPLEPVVYEAAASERVEIKRVRIPAYGTITAAINVRNTGELKPGSEFQFHVQQVVGKSVIGGSAYVVRIAGTPELNPAFFADSVDIRRPFTEEQEGGGRQLKYVPPFARQIVAGRENLLKKTSGT